MAAAKNTAPKAQAPDVPETPAAAGVTETKVGALSIQSNDKFTVVDNTAAAASVPSLAKASNVREGGLNGFTVVDYL